MELADVKPIHRMANQARVREFLFDDKPVSLEFIGEIHERSFANFKSHAFGIWILREKVIDVAIGFCGLRVVDELDEVEILYALSETKWHFGYAIEAARAVEQYAFERAGLERLISITDRPNLASWRVLEKLGMREYRPAGASKQLRYAVITRPEFQAR